MIDYHHTFPNFWMWFWDVFWTTIAMLWVVGWYRWHRSNYALPDWVMNR